MTATTLQTIDADAHIDETEDTWNFLEEKDLQYKPTTGQPKNPDPRLPPTRYWVIDGKRRFRGFHDDSATSTTAATRELLDPQARLKHMDELGTAVQVLYPTLFLAAVADNPVIDQALKHSYNRWLADRCHDTNGRLRWVCAPAMGDINKAIEEVRFAKANGACAVLKKGDREAGYWVNEEYYFPLYAECQKLDLPIAFHLGAGEVDTTPAKQFNAARFRIMNVPPLHAFWNLVLFGVPAKFPALRWGFIEAGSSWVPFLITETRRRFNKMKQDYSAGHVYEKPSDFVTKNNFYVACLLDEDLPYILRYTSEDNLLIGSDYGHEDPAQQMRFAQELRSRADAGDIAQSAVQKIVSDNARKFYGL